MDEAISELVDWSMKHPDEMRRYLQESLAWAKPIIDAMQDPETNEALIKLAKEVQSAKEE